MKKAMKYGFAVIDRAEGKDAQKKIFRVDIAKSEPTRWKMTCKGASLKIDVAVSREPLCTIFDGIVTDTTGKDRTISLFFETPIAARTITWHDDIRNSREVQAGKTYENTSPAQCGNGTISSYPIGTVSGVHRGSCTIPFCKSIGLDPTRPAQFAIGYDADGGTLFIRYDFALVPETVAFPSSATFRFVVFDSDPDWGFRGAFDKYMKIFAEQFAVRLPSQGIWMPFSAIDKIEGYEDFGFRFHEIHGIGSDFDSSNGFAAYNYTEPFTWWMNMPKSMPRTYENAIALLEKYADPDCKEAYLHERALAVLNSGIRKQDGKFAVEFYKYPWCDGACWCLNPNPYQKLEPNGASVNWSETKKAERHPPLGRLAGEYIDSTEGYTTPELNFDRKSFEFETAPLTFDSKTLKPGILKGIAVFEITRKMSGEMHEMGKTLFGNGLPYRFPWLLANFDVMGTETVWLDKKKRYAPIEDTQMALWRTLSGKKPYILLQNTDFKAFDSTMVEKYMQRVLFYALYPSMFSVDAGSDPYWENPQLYNRDRELFKKYIPLIRMLGEAGWEPVTLAKSSDPAVFVERYGTKYLTLCNETKKSRMVRIALDFPSGRFATERISGKRIRIANDGTFAIELAPQSSAMLDFGIKRAEEKVIEPEP